ncbi:cyclic nucleotide-binding domain containing protein [Niveomyces insectorum RCEF 264]|uniref:Cyclic nucleotide-binding domain containing protein n=1 Tax=Niveomyces insectorum RCEF 264 TaxID=1081102 RepID=A0A167N8D4_9HYPO|nr:cyclic nucleotide-binding domain containing protein [Niveomyces insectorum RCEF 264]
MRRARGSSPTSPFRALAHHANHGGSAGQDAPGSVSSLIRSFNVETNPTRPIRPSPLTASTIPDMPLDLVDRIRSFPLFMSAPDEFLAAIGKHLRPQIHSAHDHILTEGDDAKAMYWLVRGVVAVTSRDGEAVYAELKPGAFFGEIGVLMDVPRTATIVARTKCLLVVLKKEDLQAELPRFPDMEQAILQEAQERLTILKKKQQERRASGGGGGGGSNRINNYHFTLSTQISHGMGSRPLASLPGEVSTAEVGVIGESNTTVTKSKKRKSPSPGIIEDPAIGGSALGGGYVNVRKTLKELPLFASLPPDILHFLGLSAQPKSYAPFTDIIRQGSFGHEIYFVVSGEAEVVHEPPKGTAAAEEEPPDSQLSFARPRLTQGQYFGEVASLGFSRGRTATVRSITSVECLMISGEALDELWRRCPPEVKHQVEKTARERYEQQAANGGANAKGTMAAGAQADAKTTKEADDDVDMRDASGVAGTWLAAKTASIASAPRRHSVPNVVFTTPSSPIKDEADVSTRQPTDPDPFLSVDMENMRNRRRNSLAPPTPLPESMAAQTLPAQPPTENNSSPLKLFTFPPLSLPPSPGSTRTAPAVPPNKGGDVRDHQSHDKVVLMQGPFKKARTLARSPHTADDKMQEVVLTATAASTHQLLIPPESVLLSVFQYFDIIELIRLQGVCRGWKRLLTTAPSLCTHVDLSPYGNLVTDWSLTHIIAPFVGLRPLEMDISNCFHITDEGFQVLWRQCGKNIKAWRMKSVWDVSANQILDMSENAPGLEEIDWSNCRKVGDNLLARVVGWVVPQPLPPVPSSTTAATTTGKNVVITNSKAANATPRNREPVKMQPPQPPPPNPGPPPGTVIGCPNLTILDLSYCKHITDRSMGHLAAHASHRLRSLSLTRCTSVTDAGFQAWAPYRFNALTHLCLADCTYLSDNAMVALVNAAKNLTHLDLSFCCALSDTATEVVALGLPRLQELRLAFCGSAVSDASLRCVALHLNDLRGLSVRGCVRVTGVGVEHVLDGCGRLAWLDASQCKNLAGWVEEGGIGRWGYDERCPPPFLSVWASGSVSATAGGDRHDRPPAAQSSAWKPANRTRLALSSSPSSSLPLSSLPFPSMRGQRRRTVRRAVKFIIEKGPFDGLR